MSENSEPAELTREGLFETLVGKTKEAAGELVGNDELADAGREQQAHAAADGADAAADEASDDRPAVDGAAVRDASDIDRAPASDGPA